MSDTDRKIPPDVQQFVRSYITSTFQLEILLLLFHEQATIWTPSALAQKLYLHPDAAADQLSGFAQQGLLEVAPQESERGYCYRPSVHDETLARLALWYRDRRVTMTNFIYAQPNDVVRSFADAFKLRNKNKE